MNVFQREKNIVKVFSQSVILFVFWLVIYVWYLSKPGKNACKKHTFWGKNHALANYCHILLFFKFFTLLFTKLVTLLFYCLSLLLLVLVLHIINIIIIIINSSYCLGNLRFCP